MHKINRLLTMGRRLGAGLAFLPCLLLLTSLGWSAEEAKPAAPPAAKTAAPATPQPEKVLQQACDFLKAAKQFSFKAEVTDDRVYTEGKKLQFAFDLEVLVNANHLGYKIAEAPIVLNSQRSFGRIGAKAIYTILLDTLAIFYRMYILRYYDRIDYYRRKNLAREFKKMRR